MRKMASLLGPVALAAMFVAWAIPAAAASSRYSFRTLEGEVASVGEQRAEGDLPVLSVEIVPDRTPEERLTVLLGPSEACREIGLEVEEGDRVRVRVVLGAEGEPVKAQRILNMSRSVMVRLRTMRAVPLWDAGGAWQGAAGRAYRRGVAGPHGGAGKGGKGPGGPGR